MQTTHEKQTFLKMTLNEALYAAHTSQLKPAQLMWYGVVQDIKS